MARPPDADSAKTYDSILAAALRVLEAEGEHGSLSLRAVAREAGCSQGTVQYYFGSREELLEACLDGYYERLDAAVGAVVSEVRVDQPARSVELAARAFWSWARRDRALVRFRLGTTIVRGELHPRRRQLLFGRGLAGWVPALCAMCGMEETEARLAVQALASRILGLAILQPDDMAAFVEAEPGASPEAVLALAEAHVARTAVRLLTP